MTLEEERDHWKQQYEECEEDYEHIVTLMERRIDQLTAELDEAKATIARIKLRAVIDG